MKKGIIMEKLRATEVIRCPARLLKASNVNIDHFLFSSSPVNIPSYSLQKYTFVFVFKKKQKQNRTKQKNNRVSYSGWKIIVIRDINGMKAF